MRVSVCIYLRKRIYKFVYKTVRKLHQNDTGTLGASFYSRRVREGVVGRLESFTETRLKEKMEVRVRTLVDFTNPKLLVLTAL